MTGESDIASLFTGAVATASAGRAPDKTSACPSAPRNAPASHVENGAVNGDAANTNNVQAQTTRIIGRDRSLSSAVQARRPPLRIPRGVASTSAHLLRKVSASAARA